MGFETPMEPASYFLVGGGVVPRIYLRWLLNYSDGIGVKIALVPCLSFD